MNTPASPSLASPSSIKERTLEAAATAKESFGLATGSLKEIIIQHPARALSVALGLGVVLGWLIKRR